MFFRSRPPDNVLALQINNVVLPRVAATKFLGTVEPLLYDHPQNHIGVVV